MLRAFAWGALLLLLGAACLLTAATPALAYPGEPTVTVTVSPTDITVDASGVNPVDTVFLVNITAANPFTIRTTHTMWVNISLSVDRGWVVNPSVQNLTYTLDPMGSEDTSIPVTVTVPPGSSATDAAVFSAAFTEENDMPFSAGMAGNRTAQIHIRQTFSTGASFTGGVNYATAEQGQPASYNITVQNNGNGDAEYDADVLNADELRPNDIVVDSTVPAVVPEGGNAVVRVNMRATTTAIPGTYQVQIRVFATGAGEEPPASAHADLTATLNIKSAAPPPNNNNNTTTPPPNDGNNTTTGGNNNPPPPGDVLSAFVQWVTTGTGPIITAVVAAIIAVISLVVVSSRRKKRRKRARIEQARERRRQLAERGGGTRPGGAVGHASPGGPVRPVRRAASVPGQRPGAQDLKRRGPN